MKLPGSQNLSVDVSSDGAHIRAASQKIVRRSAGALAALVCCSIPLGCAQNVQTESIDISAYHTPSHAAAAEAEELCPWRNPDRDRTRYFPKSTGYRTEFLVLTRQRTELAKLLGHRPQGSDNRVQVYRVLHADRAVGCVMTRRVTGEYGLIELMLAFSPSGRVLGAAIQRIREPEQPSRYLTGPLMAAFVGKDCTSPWTGGSDLPVPPSAAAVDASAVAGEARTAAALLAVGDRLPLSGVRS